MSEQAVPPEGAVPVPAPYEYLAPLPITKHSTQAEINERSQWELAHPTIQRSNEDAVREWVQGIYDNPEGSERRIQGKSLLRQQLIAAYGFGDESGNLDDRDEREVAYRMNLLGRLAMSSGADHVDRARAETFAYEFFNLIWKDAGNQNKLEDAVALSLHDSLTGLLNREGFMKMAGPLLERAERGELLGLAVAFADLDDFKSVNDQLGHEAGDALLVGVTEVMINNTRSMYHTHSGMAAADARHGDDIVARAAKRDDGAPEDPKGSSERAGRFGGDEFMTLLAFYGYDDRASLASLWKARTGDAEGTMSAATAYEITLRQVDGRAKTVVTRLEAEMAGYLQRATHGRLENVQLGVSVGYVLWEPGMDLMSLMRDADAAMYRVKVVKKAQKGAALGEDKQGGGSAGNL